MNLINLKKEYKMQLEDSIKCTKTIKKLSDKDTTIEYLYNQCFQELLKNTLINDSKFINFSNKIIEVEDDQESKDNYIWLVECIAKIYTSVDK